MEGKTFIRAKNMSIGKKMMDASINEWILSLSEEEIHAFVDTLYEVISASEASNIFEFGADWKKSLQSVIEAAKSVDDATRKAIQKIFRSLFETMMEKLVEKKETKRKHTERNIRKGIYGNETYGQEIHRQETYG